MTALGLLAKPTIGRAVASPATEAGLWSHRRDCPGAPSNTGVLRTSSSPPAALIDWFQWTEGGVTAGDVCGRLDLRGEARDVPGGAFGYRRSLALGPGARVYYEGSAATGVHVRLTGDGCRHLENTGAVADWPTFIESLQARGARITRVDVALDDRRGLVQLGRVVTACEEQLVVSRWRRWTTIADHEFGGDRVKGMTVTFGSPTSDMTCRIYDKSGEDSALGHWTRVELQARNARANAVADRLRRDGLVSVAGVLRGCLDFKTPTADSNRRRWPTADWWDEFLDGVGKTRLITRARPNTDLLEALQHLERQYGPTIAAIVDSYGVEEILAIATRGRLRMKRRHFDMLSRVGVAA